MKIEASSLHRDDVISTADGTMEIYKVMTGPDGLKEHGGGTTEIRFKGGHSALLVSPTELISVVKRAGA